MKRVRLRGVRKDRLFEVHAERPSLLVAGQRMLGLRPENGARWPLLSSGWAHATTIFFPETWCEEVPS